MVLISESPGEDRGAIGVVTLEDVIEELIGEYVHHFIAGLSSLSSYSLTIPREIIDESDVYVDVHKAIRRAHPAPKARIQRKDILLKDAAVKDGVLVDLAESEHDQAQRIHRASLGPRNETPTLSSSPRTTSLFVRRGSAGHTVSVKANFEDMREHLKHLGPSNPASNPKSTRVSAVKIKP